MRAVNGDDDGDDAAVIEELKASVVSNTRLSQVLILQTMNPRLRDIYYIALQ